MTIDMSKYNLVEIRPGVWKSKDDVELDELEWRKWRNSLSLVPLFIQGQMVTIEHGSFEFPLEVEATCILSGDNGLYFDSYRLSDRERLVLAVSRVTKITTQDGVVFDDCLEWVSHRARTSVDVAEKWGLIIPAPEARR